ncbi:MAG: tRNA (adenosine(37)-N6)-threonylcarbamoyltransferase complex transferase subunit TsaD, partial [Clostridia bacterium]|nr:tRNA (adenosine(37)-N6)-threonylcarbamoyltransferase complex transferase subunit TsaD [Clostridia bacterium]
VCDILIDTTMRAAEQYGHRRIAVAGGVSANSELRRRLDEECQKRNRELFYPELCYCGDNAAMVGVQGFYEYAAGKRAQLSLNAFATRTVEEG